MNDGRFTAEILLSWEGVSCFFSGVYAHFSPANAVPERISKKNTFSTVFAVDNLRVVQYFLTRTAVESKYVRPYLAHVKVS
jgi:hypothetical protein